MIIRFVNAGPVAANRRGALRLRSIRSLWSRVAPCPASPPPTSSRSATGSSEPRSRSSPRRATTGRRSPTSSRDRACRSARSTRYFRGKDELFLQSCDLISGQGLDELGDPARAADDDAPSGCAAAIAYYVETIDEFERRARPGRRSSGPGRRPARSPASARCSSAGASGSSGPRQLLLQRGHRPRRAARLARRRGARPRVHGAARRAAAPAHRGRRRLPPRGLDPPRDRRPRRPARRRACRAPGRRRRRSIGRPWPTSRPSSARSTRPTSGSRCRTSTPRSRCGTSRTAGTTGSSRATSRSSSRSSRRSARPAAAALVDLTLARRRAATRPGSAGLARATGLHIVMGCGWYREAYYPAEARIDRRSVDDLADELVREATDGVGDTGVRPGIIGEIGTDKPWVSALEERVHRAAARAARRTGLAITTHAVLSPVGLDQLRDLRGGGRRPDAGRHRPRRLVPASRPPPRDRRARRERRVRLPRHVVHAGRAPRRGPHRRARSASCWRAATSSGSCCPRTSATTRSSTRYGGNGYTYLAGRSCRGCARPGVSDAEIETMTVANPRRLLTIG